MLHYTYIACLVYTKDRCTWFPPFCKLFVNFLLHVLSFRNIFSDGSPDNIVYFCFVLPFWFSDLCLWKICLLVGRHLEIGMPISWTCLRRYHWDIWGSVRFLVTLMVGGKKVLVTVVLIFHFDIIYIVCYSTDLCSACCVYFLSWISICPRRFPAYSSSRCPKCGDCELKCEVLCIM